jgi:hypothetical protein
MPRQLESEYGLVVRGRHAAMIPQSLTQIACSTDIEVDVRFAE